jgi:Putative beta-lactamase-inhibitor-like, PepSY-like
MKTSIPFVAVLLMLALSFGKCAVAAEHSVACSTLPPAVQQKSKLMLDGSVIHECVRDISKGKTTYELELLKDGRNKDVTFDPDGNVLEVEEQIDFASLPKLVAAAIQKEVGAGHLGKIESLTRGSTLIVYETTVTRNGKRREIAFRPDGSVMKPD